MHIYIILLEFIVIGIALYYINKLLPKKTINLFNVKESLDDLWDSISLPKEYRPKLIINIGEYTDLGGKGRTILYRDKIQYILIDVDEYEIFYYLNDYYNTRFSFVDRDVFYVGEDGIKVYVGDLYDFLNKHILYKIEEFYCYSHFIKSNNASSVACVGYIPTTKQAVGYTHRGRFVYTLNQTFDLHKDRPAFLEHGYIPEVGKLFDEETERINIIRRWGRDGKIILDTKEKLLYAAFRAAESIS